METNSSENKRKKSSIYKNVALILLGIISAAAIVFGYLQYTEKNDFVARAIEEQKANEQYVLDAFARIEGNLAKIRTHEGLIKESLEMKDAEGDMSQEDRINYEIKVLEKLMEENQKIIANLNEEIDSKNNLLASYEKSVRNLKGRIAEYKDMVTIISAERDTLKQNLAVSEEARGHLEQTVMHLNDEVDQRNATIEEQEQALLDREKALNTAFYAIGSYKDLREKDIVEKEGGILGIASVMTLSDNLNTDKFNRVDLREVTQIPVMAKRAEIITNQDTATYKMEYNDGIVEKITITDPVKFWENSKYLVVVVRDSADDELASAK